MWRYLVGAALGAGVALAVTGFIPRHHAPSDADVSTWYSLEMIFACRGNPAAHAWSPTVEQGQCDKGFWGYTDPLLDFRTKSDCNMGGMRVAQQQPHVYVTWRCVVDPNK